MIKATILNEENKGNVTKIFELLNKNNVYTRVWSSNG